jgi:ribosomal protein L2
MPVTPGRRHQQRPIHEHLYKGGPVRKLTVAKRGTGGRNHSGKITCRHRGGGHKRRIRIIDYQRREPGPQTVVRIEYDPGRSGHIALIQHDETGKQTYILAAEGLRAGDKVESYRAGIPKRLLEKMNGKIDPGIMATETIVKGNCLPLRLIPLSTVVFGLGLRPIDGAKLCRSAGASAQVLQQEGPYAVCKLASGEVRKFKSDVCATIGVMSNEAHQHMRYGKAGRMRWLGIRPTVRGVAMNANEHPHGGGRGKSKGNKHTRSICLQSNFLIYQVCGDGRLRVSGRGRRLVDGLFGVVQEVIAEKLGDYNGSQMGCIRQKIAMRQLFTYPDFTLPMVYVEP